MTVFTPITIEYVYDRWTILTTFLTETKIARGAYTFYYLQSVQIKLPTNIVRAIYVNERREENTYAHKISNECQMKYAYITKLHYARTNHAIANIMKYSKNLRVH